MNRTFLIITLILLLSGIKLYSKEAGDNKQDTIVLKNFYLNPKYYRGGKRVYVRNFKTIMQNNPTVLTELKTARTLRVLGYSLAFVGGGITGTGAPSPYQKADNGLIISGIFIAGGGFILDYIAESKLRNVVRIYNKNPGTPKTSYNSSSLGIGFSYKGLFLKATF